MKTGTASLAIVEDNVILRNVKLDKNITVIGRSDECDFVLSGREVSRRHCQVIRTDHGFLVEDLGSANGTFINGQPIQRQELKHGDKIDIADFTLTFNDGRGLPAAVDETRIDQPGEETQTLRAHYAAVKKKVRERELAAVLDEHQQLMERSRQRHKQLANRDRLTGVFNRGYFDDHFPRFLRAAQERQEPLSLFFIDLDHFKKVNDTRGHEQGDKTLKIIAQLLLAACRRDDVVARYGGEEFVIIFPNMKPANAFVVAETLRSVIEQKSPGLLGFLQTVSIGLATFPEHGADAKSLLQAADRALYQAKAAGRNRVIKSS